jgi:hypothetical protein
MRFSEFESDFNFNRHLGAENHLIMAKFVWDVCFGAGALQCQLFSLDDFNLVEICGIFSKT